MRPQMENWLDTHKALVIEILELIKEGRIELALAKPNAEVESLAQQFYQALPNTNANQPKTTEIAIHYSNEASKEVVLLNETSPSQMESFFPLMDLPKDIVFHIGCYLDLKDYIQLHSTCKSLVKKPETYYDRQVVFDLAIEKGNASVIDSLKDHPSIDLSDKRYAICISEEYEGEESIVDCFKYCCSKGHFAVVELLLSDPEVNPAADNNYAIRMASENGHRDVVELLLVDERVDPAADDNYARYSNDGQQIHRKKNILI